MTIARPTRGYRNTSSIEAGYRSKVAVSSLDTKVDAVGACVGVRGTRIKNIVDELGGERIDIVRWNESLQVLIPNALQPAEIDEVMLCHLLGRAIVLVRDDQLSLAIGRRGQNVRLASKLVGWDIEIMTAEELDEVIEKAVKSFEKIDNVETELAERLVEQGILSYDDLSVMEIPDLVNTIEGLSEEQATEIVSRAEVMAEEQSEELPRRKGGRAAAALLEQFANQEAAEAQAESAEVGELVGEADPSDEEAAASRDDLDGHGDDESVDYEPGDDESEITNSGNPAATIRSALPPEHDPAAVDDLPTDEIPDPEADEASDDEIHDLALAEEKSGRKRQGHEVTSKPNDEDQGATLRIVTDAVEKGAAGRPATAGSASPPALAPTTNPDDRESTEVTPHGGDVS
jgi:transcription termination/antitermination protein NusA